MSILALILIVAAGSVVIGGIIAGLLSYSTTRIERVRNHEHSVIAELYEPVNIQVKKVVVHDRPDRHVYYVGILVALWFAGVGVMLVPIGTGALATLPSSTQKLLAFTLILGSGLSLLGASLGPSNKPRRRWNPLRWWFPILNDGQAYGIGAGGQFALSVALGYFGLAVIANGSLIGAVTGLITPVLSVCSFRMGRMLWREHKRLDAEWWSLKRAATGEDET